MLEGGPHHHRVEAVLGQHHRLPGVEPGENVGGPQVAVGHGETVADFAEAAGAPGEHREHPAVDVERDHLGIGEPPQKPEAVDSGARAGVEHAGPRRQPPVHALEELLDPALEAEDAQPGVVELGDTPVGERGGFPLGAPTVGTPTVGTRAITARVFHVRATRLAITPETVAGAIDRSSSAPSDRSASAVQLSTQSPVLQ